MIMYVSCLPVADAGQFDFKSGLRSLPAIDGSHSGGWKDCVTCRWPLDAWPCSAIETMAKAQDHRLHGR